VARRHAEYYRDLFQRAEADFETRPTAEWLAAYRPHLDDVRLALDWAFSPSGDAGVAVALTAAAIPLWAHVSLVTDCRGRVEQAIASLGRQVPPDPRRDMQLYLALGYAYLHTLGGGQEMNAALTKALELAEIMNDTRCRLGAIYGLYVYRHTTGDYRGALTLGEKFAPSQPRRPIVPMWRSASTHRSCVARSGRPAWCATTPRAVGSLARRDGSASHITLYQFDQRVFSIATTRAFSGCRDWRSGNAAHGELVDYARTTDHALSFLYALLIAACPIALYVGDLTTVEPSRETGVRPRRQACAGGLEACGRSAFEGILLIKRGDIARARNCSGRRSRCCPNPPFDHT
jgi:hypothetical protein